ncbi:STAS domain-containing protein [Nocardiopsis sp. CNT312]|uniref:STAS domain-containing protein n=1 Tax=Nocardiopsis sp. CNT312 TaxID=1137268 RepID=UPI00048CA000|nr:STAS domain-containing protein [Nocardiopsis sp. CNT312]
MTVLDTERGRFVCGGTTVVELDGEIDMATADHVFARLSSSVSTECAVADLSLVEFIDASGVNALLAAQRVATRSRHHLVLACPPRQLTRILDVLSLHPLLPTHADVAAACAAHGRAVTEPR